MKAPEKKRENLPTLIDRAVFPGLQGGPHMNVIAAKAVAFGEALHPSFKIYSVQIIKNAKAMEEVFKRGGVHMIGGGTSNHLLLLDVFGSLGVTGKEAQEVLDIVHISTSRSTIPEEPRTPYDPSGLRIGTPAITTRGFGEGESARVAELMLETLKSRADKKKLGAIREEVRALCKKFPIPDSFV